MCRDGFTIILLSLDYATSLNRFVLHYVIKSFFRGSSSFLTASVKMCIETYFALFLNLVLHLASPYTSQLTHVCTFHLALTLSSPCLFIGVFSSIKPLIPTITIKDTMWTQANV